MTNEENQTPEVSETLQKAVEEAYATPEPAPVEREPYFFEKVGLTRGRKNFFRTGTKTRPDNLAKIVDNQVVELHKPRTVINRFTKKPEIVGVPIAVKDEKSNLKFWTDKGLVTNAENYKFWEDREAFNKVIKK